MPETGKIFNYSKEECVGCLDPLTNAIRAQHRSGETTVVGIQGGQGTGKTTLAAYLVSRLAGEGFRAVSFSIDDFYTDYEDRNRLAAQHPDNPFYRLPRGMPGTHRTDELHTAIARLKDGGDVDLPVFDKSAHKGHGDIADRVVPVRGRQDIVLFEGWFVGMPGCTVGELVGICRRQGLESMGAMFDPAHLAVVLSNMRPYQRLWRLMDFFVMLYPDSLSLHELWRLEQERELIARRGVGMAAEEVRTLVRHFLPFTCLCYARAEPHLRVKIDGEHRLYACEKGPARNRQTTVE